MSNLIKIGIHETGEIFDSRKCLADELGINENTLGNYIFKKIPWNGLTFYQIKPGSSEHTCRTCSCLLTELNSKQYLFNNGDYICISCLNKYNKEKNKVQRKKYPFRTKLHSLKSRYNDCNISSSDLIELWNNQYGKCSICDCKLDKHKSHIDHIIPVSHDGETSIYNLQFLCEKCNRGKFTWSVEEYIEHCKKVAERNWELENDRRE